MEEFPSLSVPMATPTFSYALSSTTKYHVLLDQTRVMGERDRWTNVKRALFRFIDLVPIGSQLNIITFGLAANEVLPTTTVTENNRDGVFGRIPRRILDDQEACVICAFQKILPGVGSNEVVLLITGSDRRMADHDSVLTDVEEKNLPVYVVSYPATVDPSYMDIARFGGTFAVVENNSALHPLTHLQEILANVISETESETVEKLHETHYNSLGFAGTFTFEKERRTDLIITLNVPDEEKVEFFEVKDPSGKKQIFSKFKDGMVYFKFPGRLPSGIWSYHAKLYPDVAFPQTKMTVDVITKSEDSNGIFVEVFTDVDNTIADVAQRPVLIFAKVHKNNLPVLNASATVWVYMPGTPEENPVYELMLHDNGLGYLACLSLDS